MVGGIGLGALSRVIHPYPTQAEAIRKVADAYNLTRLPARVRLNFERWLAWWRRARPAAESRVGTTEAPEASSS